MPTRLSSTPAVRRHRFHKLGRTKIQLDTAIAARILALEKREGMSFDRLLRYWIAEGLERAEEFWED
jgi:hypothetical protein